MPRAEACSAYYSVTPLVRHFDNLCRGIDWVLADEEGLSPHLHFPVMRHLKEIPSLPGYVVHGPIYDDPWDRAQYERDLSARR